MQGLFYRFYVRENQRIHEQSAWEWLIEHASRLGFRGGSAFRAIGGFGRHPHLDEGLSFEFTGAPTVVVEFIVTDDEAQRLLGLLDREKLQLFYMRVPAQLGVSSPSAVESAAVMSSP